MSASETSARWLRKARREVALAREASDPEVRRGHVGNAIHDSDRAVFVLIEKRIFVRYADQKEPGDDLQLAYVVEGRDGRKQTHRTCIEEGRGALAVTVRATASDEADEVKAALRYERIREARNHIEYDRDDDDRVPPDLLGLEEAEDVYEEAVQALDTLEWDLTEEERVFWRRLMAEKNDRAVKKAERRGNTERT